MHEETPRAPSPSWGTHTKYSICHLASTIHYSVVWSSYRRPGWESSEIWTILGGIGASWSEAKLGARIRSTALRTGLVKRISADMGNQRSKGKDQNDRAKCKDGRAGGRAKKTRDGRQGKSKIERYVPREAGIVKRIAWSEGEEMVYT